MLDSFEATLGRHTSATSALEDWCASQQLASQTEVRAMPAPGRHLAASPETRAALRVGPAEHLGYRHVRLACGGKVLSVAHNWYVPARLTSDMNAAL